jgi:hypothetical protein
MHKWCTSQNNVAPFVLITFIVQQRKYNYLYQIKKRGFKTNFHKLLDLIPVLYIKCIKFTHNGNVMSVSKI